jgi:hypothetical protein
MKKPYVLSALVLATLCAVSLNGVTAQAEETTPAAYALMTQAPWETEAMEDEPVYPQPDTNHTVEDEAPNGKAPTPSHHHSKAMMKQQHEEHHHPHHTVATAIVMPHHTRKLKPLAAYVPTKRPVTPEHTPWKEMRAFNTGGDLMGN